MLKQQIIECGFTEAQAEAALKRKSTLEGAIQWILSPEGAAILAREQPAAPAVEPEDPAVPEPAPAPAAAARATPLAQQVMNMGFPAGDPSAANLRGP